MNVTTLPLEGVLLIEPAVFHDERGYFFESFNANTYKQSGLPHDFVQDNHSLSKKGVLRGLHFQLPPYEQGKLVRVVRGAAWDVVVDIRKASSTYGKYIGVELNESSQTMLWIPPGFAHGFLAKSNDTVFLYKCTKPYHKSSERGILWNDPTLAIDWGIDNPLVSEKDLELGTFADLVSEF